MKVIAIHKIKKIKTTTTKLQKKRLGSNTVHSYIHRFVSHIKVCNALFENENKDPKGGSGLTLYDSLI